LKKRGVEGLKKEELVKEKLQRSLIWMWLWLARLWMGVMVTEMKTKGVQLRAWLSFCRVKCQEFCKYASKTFWSL